MRFDPSPVFVPPAFLDPALRPQLALGTVPLSPLFRWWRRGEEEDDDSLYEAVNDVQDAMQCLGE